MFFFLPENCQDGIISKCLEVSCLIVTDLPFQSVNQFVPLKHSLPFVEHPI
jgi:hypothetical protein